MKQCYSAIALILLTGLSLSAFAAETTIAPGQSSTVAQAESWTPNAQLATEDDSMTAIGKRIENPANAIVTVPFVYQLFTGAGLTSNSTEGNQIQSQLQIRPTIPFVLNSDWMFINRDVVPIEFSTPNYGSQGSGPSSGYTAGLGNITLSGFLTPRDQESKLLWGVGPVISLPTATNLSTGSGNWGLGPTVLAVFKDGPWIVGSVIENVWSVGSSSKPQNLMNWQFFAHYNFTNGWALSTTPQIFANWIAASNDDRYTVPLGLGVTKTFEIGQQISSISIQEYYYVLHPTNGPQTLTQISLTLIYP